MLLFFSFRRRATGAGRSLPSATGLGWYRRAERLTPSQRQTALPKKDSTVWTFATKPRRRFGLRGFFQGDLLGLGLEHLDGQKLLQLRVLPIQVVEALEPP